jgi:hypothetical protein
MGYPQKDRRSREAKQAAGAPAGHSFRVRRSCTAPTERRSAQTKKRPRRRFATDERPAAVRPDEKRGRGQWPARAGAQKSVACRSAPEAEAQLGRGPVAVAGAIDGAGAQNVHAGSETAQAQAALAALPGPGVDPAVKAPRVSLARAEQKAALAEALDTSVSHPPTLETLTKALPGFLGRRLARGRGVQAPYRRARPASAPRR